MENAVVIVGLVALALVAFAINRVTRNARLLCYRVDQLERQTESLARTCIALANRKSDTKPQDKFDD